MAKGLDIFKKFFQSEKSGGFILIICTVVSLIIANSAAGDGYVHFWHQDLNLSFGAVNLNYKVEEWINDGLMAIFFFLVGLEIERELYVGELSSFKNAILPIVAAIGGMVVPALIHFAFNSGTPTQAGFGIPMATDIAFALGILSLAGKQVPVSLKIFLTALAIIDDLGAITVIALFYTDDFSLFYFSGALLVYLILYFIGRKRVFALTPYIIGGILMWYCMLQSGVHATIAGVLLAFAIPYPRNGDRNPSEKVQHALHYPVAFVILPIFALANTAIIFPEALFEGFRSANSMGIIFGLLLGKTIGIYGATYLFIKLKLAKLSSDISSRQFLGMSILGGIGFTMSIFISNLAFKGNDEVIVSSKMSILAASVVAAVIGLLVVRKKEKVPENLVVAKAGEADAAE